MKLANFPLSVMVLGWTVQFVFGSGDTVDVSPIYESNTGPPLISINPPSSTSSVSSVSKSGIYSDYPYGSGGNGDSSDDDTMVGSAPPGGNRRLVSPQRTIPRLQGGKYQTPRPPLNLNGDDCYNLHFPGKQYPVPREFWSYLNPAYLTKIDPKRNRDPVRFKREVMDMLVAVFRAFSKSKKRGQVLRRDVITPGVLADTTKQRYVVLLSRSNGRSRGQSSGGAESSTQGDVLQVVGVEVIPPQWYLNKQVFYIELSPELEHHRAAVQVLEFCFRPSQLT
ncbi:hypothetical protein H4R33_005061 [Dimargaris cristalligena]|nr:hypothetical protein H4R33_005061 [Dimargaris cristalligena]